MESSEPVVPGPRRPRRLARRAGAAALVASVVSGLLGGSPAAQAAPADNGPGDAPQAGEGERTASGVPSVRPRPQSVRAGGAFAPVDGEVTLVADTDADRFAVRTVQAALRDAGAGTVHETDTGGDGPLRGTVVRVGDKAAGPALRALGASPTGDLPPGGYRLAVGETDGRATVALAGTGEDGLFHAAQTLRRLVVERDGVPGFPGVRIRDWPTAPVRGVTEGFYGEPWSRAERLELLDFLGRTKQNRYLYAPGDDPYRQAARWRDPYPAAERADFRALAQRARENHVVLGWAVSPGQSLCFSSPEDRRALVRKLDAMRALGFRAFHLQFDDVSYREWHCSADAETYGTGPEAAARAQAELANHVAAHFAAARARGHLDLQQLTVLPTEFYQEGRTAYRTALARHLRDGVQVAWTGVGVVPRTVTGGELADVRAAYPEQPVVTTDNYPVNDYAPERLFLGPYQGRDPAVAGGSAGLLAGAMAQPVASRIPLFTAADFAWNPRDYHPEESWRAAIEELAGTDPRSREAVGALAGNDASSMLGREESAYLRPLIEDFWAAHGSGDRKQLREAAEHLREAFRAMERSPRQVPGRLARDAEPWLRQLSLLGRAGDTAVGLLLAQSRGDGTSAWRAQLELRRLRSEAQDASAVVGKGVLPAFLDRALRTADGWAGVHDRDAPARSTAVHGPAGRRGGSVRKAADSDPGTAYRARTAPGDPVEDAVTLELPAARPLAAVTVLSGPGSDTRADIDVRTPDGAWQRVGQLSEGGWTQADAGGVTADAVRLRWHEDSRRPVVHEITPWYADTPGTALELSHKEAYATTGGAPAKVDAVLTGRSPRDVRGALRVDAPDGLTVRAPSQVTVQQGATTEVPLEITAAPDVRPGAHRVDVAFGGQRQSVTVRAFPATGGPDLARRAEVTSSADETPDFPAPAAADGDPESRWSSPPQDDAWLQLRLDGPARVGRLVLHWQEAYGRRYRIEASPDGRTWRTVAEVGHGRGGRETVRMDTPPDTRYLRMQGVERATRFGYSLWSVEAYAIREDDGKRGKGAGLGDAASGSRHGQR
ncbi:beta-N-acetylglucosaminidase domain-containing protein [Streptomyces sp. TR06-5]|uniref:beta-N-acetylglucosaminidase domain-containing protein n=1 Tax=Streptomyces sp. TR06-5 TaxID=3385976 RepID=UPI0039A1943D